MKSSERAIPDTVPAGMNRDNENFSFSPQKRSDPVRSPGAGCVKHVVTSAHARTSIECLRERLGQALFYKGRPWDREAKLRPEWRSEFNGSCVPRRQLSHV